MIGGVAQGVVGPWQEVEDRPAVVVWCVAFDEGEVRPFRTWAQPAAEGGVAVVGWPAAGPDETVLLLADPHTYPAAEVIRHVSDEPNGQRVIGGFLTPSEGTGRLLLHAAGEPAGDTVHEGGGVGVVLRGVRVDAIVSQGCRPVGKPFVVTKAEHNLVHELAGAPAAARLREIFEEAGVRDQRLMTQGLHVGIVADEYRDEFAAGDFLVRAVLGADFDEGTVAVGDVVRVGQVIQFQVRDASTADEDLRKTLDAYPDAVAGALLFTCNGRGSRLFGVDDHDARVVGEQLTEMVGGAFCAGEIGPVGERSHVHGFTASLAVFTAGD
jgi:small ligand-binding sensory domain FIST